MKDIVVIAHFCRGFTKSDNGRFMYLCRTLSEKHRVEIITSDFSHGTKKHKEPIKEDLSYTVTTLHELGYKKNISIKRFISHFTWGRQVWKYLNSRRKPDVVYCAVPSLSGPYFAMRFCKKNGIRFIVDVQDLWPEAFGMAFSIPVLKSLFFWPFRLMVDAIYKGADDICAVSNTYKNRALRVNPRSIEGHVAFLGTDMSQFDENVKNNHIIKPNNEVWLGYCGSMGHSYDIKGVIDALSLVPNPPIFVVMGDGPQRADLEDYTKRKGVKAIFTGRLPYERMCGYLSVCDMAVNPIIKGSPASIINKHADYAAAGLAVLNTQECDEYRDLIDNYHMGINCKNGDLSDLAQGICCLMKNADLRVTMGQNARKCAEKLFDRRETYPQLVDCILE